MMRVQGYSEACEPAAQYQSAYTLPGGKVFLTRLISALSSTLAATTSGCFVFHGEDIYIAREIGRRS